MAKPEMAYVGPETEQAIAGLRPDKCFIGAHGFTLEEGVCDPTPISAAFKRKMVEVSQAVYLVVTPDKFGNIAPQISVPLDAIDGVITNQNTPDMYIEGLIASCIRCVVVPTEDV